MHIILLCATQRGLRVLKTLLELLPPDSKLTVFSFAEDPWEPPFLDDIRAAAEAGGAAFYEARQVGSKHLAHFWETAAPDLMLMVSWRYLVPAHIFERPRRGAFIFHDSLLPAYRGFAPTIWAIINGENHTGVTLFRIADAVDSGEIVDQQQVPIGADETIAVVLARVTETYLQLLRKHFAALLAGTAPHTPQDHTKATFTCKRLPEDNRIDWTQPTQPIYNLIRAVTQPYPGAFTSLNGQKLFVWAAERLPDFPPYVGRVAGRVLQVQAGRGVVVLTGDGALLLTEVQLENQARQRADLVLNSIQLTLGR